MVLIAVLLAIKSLSLTKNIEVISLNITYLLFTIVITSIISKVIDTVISEVILPITEKSENSFDNHLVPVIQKAIRAIVWSMGIIIGLDNIGFDITAMIAVLRCIGLITNDGACF